MRIFNKIRSTARKAIAYAIREIVRKRRIGLNSHDLNSFEITTIMQNTAFSRPSAKLMNIVSDLTRAYCDFNYTDSFNNGSIWDIYNSAYTGEHYRLLALIAKATNARKVIEIGTFRGASAASILNNTNANVIGYDLMSAKNYTDNYLSNEFYENGRFTERLGDLYSKKHLNQLLDDLKDADILFLDGPKDYTFEKYIFEELQKFSSKKEILIIVDDIKLSPMVELWHSVNFEKIDISFLGHWSGTGLMLMNANNK